MKLSVCLIAYNHKPFIEKAIEGILMQKTNFDFEIVIGEDCSSDGTQEILQYYKDKYPKKINLLLNSKNLGLMANYSKTISKCKGQYIALSDGDDFWIEETKLQKQINFLEANAGYSFCFHDAKILNQDRKFSSSTCCGDKVQTKVSFKDVIFPVSPPTCSVVFRKNMLEGFPPPWFESLHAPERPIFLLLADKGPAFYFNECWATYRLHENGSWTGRSYQARWLTHLQIFRVVNRHFNNLYRKEFSKHQKEVYNLLAIDLLKNKKIKRAKCIVKRYMAMNSDDLFSKFSFYYKVAILNIYYLIYCIRAISTVKSNK